MKIGAEVPRSRGDREQPLNAYLEDRLWRLGAGGVILDLGCGRGYWLERMSAAGLCAVGVEPERDRARMAAAHGPVAVGGGAGLPIATGTLSLVWCIHVLHHLEEPSRVLEEVKRVLRPGGHLVLAETVEDNPVISIARRLWPYWDGVEVHSRFTAAALLDDVAAAGLEVVEHRQHSLLSFAAWALPVARRQAWVGLSALESRMPKGLGRWGAHVECVARRPVGSGHAGPPDGPV